jgi:hypothetical protein
MFPRRKIEAALSSQASAVPEGSTFLDDFRFAAALGTSHIPSEPSGHPLIGPSVHRAIESSDDRVNWRSVDRAI